MLTSEIQAASEQIDALAARVAELRNKEAVVADRLAEVRAELQAEKARLERLEKRLAVARKTLRKRLIEIYKSDEPDALTVILEADGFDDMMERYDYLKQISDQDDQIFTRVDDLRRESVEAVDRIAAARDEIAARKAELEQTRASLEQQEAQLDAARDQKAAALDSVESNIQQLEGDVGSIQGEIQARIQAAQERREAAEAAAAAAAAEQAEAESSAAAPAPTPAPAPSGPTQESSNGFIYPLDGPLTSPFGYRWGRMHEGIDISVPEGTPIHAAASGSVSLASVYGGYGNYTCIEHGDGVSTCYAHQSSFAVSQGDSVSQGDVIGYSGNTGSSTGPHLHFEVRVNGEAVDPMGYLP